MILKRIYIYNLARLYFLWEFFYCIFYISNYEILTVLPPKHSIESTVYILSLVLYIRREAEGN